MTRAGTHARGPARTSGPSPPTLAGLEGLDAHAAAVTLRLDALAGGAGTHELASPTWRGRKSAL